jgi:endonuclease/exonuclease/phosphatase (EEP) superfamily protein YafD
MGHGINQEKEAHRLSQFVHRHAGQEPFIVCGDFNSAPGSPVFRYLLEEGTFANAEEALGQLHMPSQRPFSTAGFLHLRMHLDHLFSGNSVEWLDLEDTRAFGDPDGRFHGLSDHVPLIGRFRLTSPPEIRT